MYDFNNVKYYGSQIMHIYIRKFHILSIHLDLKNYKIGHSTNLLNIKELSLDNKETKVTR